MTDRELDELERDAREDVRMESEGIRHAVGDCFCADPELILEIIVDLRRLRELEGALLEYCDSYGGPILVDIGIWPGRRRLDAAIAACKAARRL